jgi:hypothetical protein
MYMMERRYCILQKHIMKKEREHGGINGYTPSEMFLIKGRLNNDSNKKKIKQIKSVTHVGK